MDKTFKLCQHNANDQEVRSDIQSRADYMQLNQQKKNCYVKMLLEYAFKK